MVTHSRCRGDFSSLALAQSCAEAICATNRNAIIERYFMPALPPDRKARNLAQTAHEMRGAIKRLLSRLQELHVRRCGAYSEPFIRACSGARLWQTPAPES